MSNEATMISHNESLSPEELEVLQGLLLKLSAQDGDLRYPLFRFITEVTPTPNVDLLVLNDAKGVLLAWRSDPFGEGWHVPGSLMRHREEIAHRLAATAADEFGCQMVFSDRPLAVIEIFDDRGHSVSLCYAATLQSEPQRRVVSASAKPEPGDLCWFAELPEALYPSHFVYRDVLAAYRQGLLGDGARVFTQHVGQRDAAQATTAGSISADMPLAT